MLYICNVNILQYLHYFIRSVWYRGFFFTCKLLYNEFYYEKKLGIQTLHIENLESLDTLSNDYENNHHYQGASYYVLTLIFEKLKSFTKLRTLFDYGCGKGRVMIMAAETGFTDIQGIDLAKELCEQSQKNIAKVKHKYPYASFAVHHADATKFDDIDGIDCFFFFNPFGRTIMQQVIEQIEQSLKKYPRDIYIVYVNPQFVDTFIHANYHLLYELKSKDYLEAVILKK